MRGQPLTPLTDAQRDTAARNLGLVYAMVNLMGVEEAHRDDATAAGEDALMRAACSFDPTKGYKFSTYACMAIRRRLYSEYRRRLTRMGRVRNESDFGQDEFAPLDSRGRDVPEPHYDFDTIEMMRQCLSRLDPRTRDIVRRRFGIGCPAEPVGAIAARWGLTAGRVPRLVADGVAVMAILMGQRNGRDRSPRPARRSGRFRPGRSPRMSR